MSRNRRGPTRRRRRARAGGETAEKSCGETGWTGRCPPRGKDDAGWGWRCRGRRWRMRHFTGRWRPWRWCGKGACDALRHGCRSGHQPREEGHFRSSRTPGDAGHERPLAIRSNSSPMSPGTPTARSAASGNAWPAAHEISGVVPLAHSVPCQRLRAERLMTHSFTVKPTSPDPPRT